MAKANSTAVAQIPLDGDEYRNLWHGAEVLGSSIEAIQLALRDGDVGVAKDLAEMAAGYACDLLEQHPGGLFAEIAQLNGGLNHD